MDKPDDINVIFEDLNVLIHEILAGKISIEAEIANLRDYAALIQTSARAEVSEVERRATEAAALLSQLSQPKSRGSPGKRGSPGAGESSSPGEEGVRTEKKRGRGTPQPDFE